MKKYDLRNRHANFICAFKGENRISTKFLILTIFKNFEIVIFDAKRISDKKNFELTKIKLSHIWN